MTNLVLIEDTKYTFFTGATKEITVDSEDMTKKYLEYFRLNPVEAKKAVYTQPLMYRKIPSEHPVLKFVYTEEGIEAVKLFLGKSLGKINKERHPDAKAELEILTLEDGKTLTAKHIATEGDYLIQGINGEFWAIKPDIFKKSYELIEEE